MVEWVPSGTIVNQYYYKEVFIKLKNVLERSDQFYVRTAGFFTKTKFQPYSALLIQRF